MKSKIILGLLGLSVLLLGNPPSTHRGYALAAQPPVYSWDAPKLYDGSLYGKEVKVELTVVDSKNTGKACFLNASENWKKDFTAVIFQSDYYKFPNNPEKYYYGKKLRVKGTLKEYQGKPEIILKSPAQIEIIKTTNNY